MIQQAGNCTTPRWHGEKGRMEVWYATCSEPDGTGWWFHYERLAPIEGTPFAHGWAALFPTEGPPRVERFGPTNAPEPMTGNTLLAGDGWTLRRGNFAGKTGGLTWDITLATEAPSLYSFPKWSWEREVLPGAHVVDIPQAIFTGEITIDGEMHPLKAYGGQAHIYSHGSPPRWSWLHADLDNGDLCEIVAAAPHLPGNLKIPPRPVIRLRLDGKDYPRDSLIASLRGKATTTLPDWHAHVSLGGGRRLEVEVSLPPERCVQLEYPRPDGTRAYCTNSERADVRIELQRRQGRERIVERSWELSGTAHAEVGLSKPWGGLDWVPFKPM